MGTAYAVWVGIGAVGTAVLGIVLFNESIEMLILVSLGLICAGSFDDKFARNYLEG